MSWQAYIGSPVEIGVHFDLGFGSLWNDELEGMNSEKRGRPYEFPDSDIDFPLPLFRVRLNPSYRVIQGIMEAFTEHFKVNSLVAAVSSKEAKRSVVRVATSFFLAHPTIGLRQERKS